MGLIDCLIVIIPVTFVIGMGFYSRKYIRGVADFLAAGRVCGRYVICVGDVANALSIIGLGPARSAGANMPARPPNGLRSSLRNISRC